MNLTIIDRIPRDTTQIRDICTRHWLQSVNAVRNRCERIS
jgi:hypothetical protein